MAWVSRVSLRHAAKYCKLCLHCVPKLNNYDVTEWVDASCRIRRRYFLEPLLMTANRHISMRGHSGKFSIYAEVCYGQKMLKYKDKDVDLVAQAKSCFSSGHVDDRLRHCAIIASYSCLSVALFNSIWWTEMAKSLQDQISVPYTQPSR